VDQPHVLAGGRASYLYKLKCEAGMPSPFLLSLDGESKMVRAKTCLDTGFSQHGCLFLSLLSFGQAKESDLLPVNHRLKN